jgi:hypothetical protein
VLWRYNILTKCEREDAKTAKEDAKKTRNVRWIYDLFRVFLLALGAFAFACF